MLEPLAISEDGILMLDRTRLLHESHRHFSHVMAIYPLHLVNYNTEEGKRIIDASIAQLEEYGNYKWCGFSYGMMAQIYAMAKRGDGAVNSLRIFEDCYVAENGFHLNGDFKRKLNTIFSISPFTLEAEFCFNDAIQEMLMQEHEGYLELLPAIPHGWRSVSFKKLRTHGALLVSLKLRKGKITSLEFAAKRDMTLKIKDTRNLSTLLGVEAKDGFITLSVKKGKTKF
jgi:alpha-L-fucosidase 2